MQRTPAALLAAVALLCTLVLVCTSRMQQPGAAGSGRAMALSTPRAPVCPTTWDASSGSGSIAFLHIPKTAGTFLTR